MEVLDSLITKRGDLVERLEFIKGYRDSFDDGSYQQVRHQIDDVDACMVDIEYWQFMMYDNL